MESTNVVIEITDTEIRLIVGYVKDNNICLTHVAERPCKGLVCGGQILDFNTLGQILNSMREFKDETTKEKFIINEATLVLPPYGLEIYQSKQTTNVVSHESIIDTLDINNLISIVSKVNIPQNSEIIEIVPDQFIISNGRTFTKPPLEEKSDNLSVVAKVFTLPSRIVTDYKRLMDAAHIKIRRIAVSPYALCEASKSNEEIPPFFIMVDIGDKSTTLSLCGNKSPFASHTFECGGHLLVSKIAEEFKISENDALELLNLYGYDKRSLSFKPIISTAEVEKEIISFTPDDLNKVIESWFENTLMKNLNVGLDNLLAGYKDNVRSLPLVFAGAFTNMIGFKEIFESKRYIEKFYRIESNAIGARNCKYAACIGGLIISSCYRGTYSDVIHSTNLELKREN